MRIGSRILIAVFGATCGLAAAAAGTGSHAHDHPALGMTSGTPHGIPRLCASPTAEALRSGAWSDAAIWSTGRVPAAGEAVLIRPEVAVEYDSTTRGALRCLDIEGRLSFRTDIATRLDVGTLTVLPAGTLEIGTAARPVAPGVTAELVFADQAPDVRVDPDQFGTGLIGLGTITLHGAVRTPTFVRLATEPLAGTRTLELAEAPAGWRVGDKLVLPDTRQLKVGEARAAYEPQWEEVTVAAIAGRTVTLDRPLAFDHRGARNVAGRLEFLPHVGNITRNVIVRSANPAGTRGHVIFVERAAVDIRHALLRQLGRTRPGVLDSAEYTAAGALVKTGTNQIGRYALHFHHVFGPDHATDAPQFTVAGNAIDDATKWGIVVHNSHYGLVRDNVVYNSRGAGIVTEDGTESHNVFARNFVLRSEGSGEFAPSSGYGGVAPDPGGEGAGFWMRGPNNIIRDNVAANVEVFGFGIAAGALGTIRVPKFKGADPGSDGQFETVDTTRMPVREFVNNEAYGAIQTGVAIGWNGTLADSRVWHATRNGITAFPADSLVLDGLTIRGDAEVLASERESPTGIWFGNYAAKDISVRGADIQGERVGIGSPFYREPRLEPGRGEGRVLIERSYLRNYVGVAIGTAHTDPANKAAQKSVTVRDSRLEPLGLPARGYYDPALISANYGMSAGDRHPRNPVQVYGYNGRAGENFVVHYSAGLSPDQLPCRETKPGIDGAVCPVSGD